MYFRKQVMEKVRKRQQLDEISEILGKKSNFNEKSYKLYDMEGEPSYSIFGNKKKKKNGPTAVPNPAPYVVSNNTASQIGNSNVDPKIGNSIRNNSKKFREAKKIDVQVTHNNIVKVFNIENAEDNKKSAIVDD